MTLSAGTSVGKPRIFIDYVSYLRTVGAIIDYDGSPDVWDMNPTKITTADQYNRVKFENNNDEIDSFIGTANYFAVLGHNATGNDFFVRKSYTFDDPDTTVDNYAPLGYSYNLPGYKIDLYPDGISGGANYFNAKADDSSNRAVGSFSVGRYFDFSHAVDLDVSYSVSHDGIKTKKTIGGRDITNINYHSQPLWGDRKPWTSGETYKYTGYNGRRSWKVSFSYIDHDSSLPQNMNEDFMINNQMLSPELGIAHTTENIVSHFLTLTLGGSLKFIFQPDVNLDQFSLCRLSKPQTTFKQVAHKTYNISFTFVETY